MDDVACVLVNFNSGALCASAVESLQAQRFRGRDGGPGTLRIVVVDNASPVDQRALLEPLAARGVDVVFHDRNEGYGGGMNLGVARTDAEFVLVMNPDILVLPGALDALVDLMRSDPRIGLAGPRGYLDAARFVMLPPNDLPSLGLHVVESLSRVHRPVGRRAAARRARRYLRAWRRTEPYDTPMVSGFAMLLRSDLARRLGPFDPRFPFYFEDADLCRRVRRAGYRVVLHPGARMIHFFDQSARSVREEVTRRYHLSRARYYEKHWGRAGAWLFRACDHYVERRSAQGEGWRFADPEELGDLNEAPILELADGAPWVLEIATDPTFLFCGGHLGEGPVVRFPAATWDALESTRWYVRVLARDGLRPLRYVAFRKAVYPLAPPTFAEYQARFGAAPEGVA